MKNPPEVYTLAHESWTAFYSLAAIARSLSQLFDGSGMNEIERNTIGGLIEAAEIIATHGEQLTAAAREAARLPVIEDAE